MNNIESLTTKLTPLFKKFKIQKAILFGSFARGEETQRSDVNLILIQKTDKRFWDRYNGLMLDLGKAVEGHAVWPLIYTPKEFERMKERTFIRKATQEGLVLFERENRRLPSRMPNALSL